LDTSVGYGLAAVALGVAGGHFSVLTTVGLPRFFGRLHLGAIGGASMTATVVGSALGPSLLAASRTHLGSYAPALLLSAIVPVGLLALTITPLHPRDRA
ncbi:MAG: MFS transporter, partial [Myxococcota bacterium]